MNNVKNDRKTAFKESKMKITTSKLIRWAGFAAMGSGILFIAMQAIHPLDALSNVTTARWSLVHYLGIVMAFLGLIGVTGIYARQAEKAGWLGLIGYLLFSLFYALTLAFQFIEAFLSPVLATLAPKFVESMLGVVTGAPSVVNLGPLPVVYKLLGFAGYALGGLLFGIATFRARILPRWAAILLSVGIVLPLLLSSLVHHPYDRILAVPVGLAIAWLGAAILTERREPVSDPCPDTGSLQLSQSAAD